MLGFPIHYSSGLRLLDFQLLGFYYKSKPRLGRLLLDRSTALVLEKLVSDAGWIVLDCSTRLVLADAAWMMNDCSTS